MTKALTTLLLTTSALLATSQTVHAYQPRFDPLWHGQSTRNSRLRESAIDGPHPQFTPQQQQPAGVPPATQQQQPPSPPTSQQKQQPASRPSECIPLDTTTACAPWTSGYYINATELALVYGLNKPLSAASDWDELVYSSTAGGDIQAKLWSSWAQCTGYTGQPIQFFRTYVCLTDIFMFSAGCNEKPPEPRLCPDTCDLYGKAVQALIRDETACPPYGQLQQTAPGDFDVLNERRHYVSEAAESCKSVLSSWAPLYADQSDRTPKQQSFRSGGYAEDYDERNSYFQESSCPSDKYFVGVQDDNGYCGFSGNLDIAKKYCADFPNAPCCTRLSAQPGKKPAASRPSSPAPPASPSSPAVKPVVPEPSQKSKVQAVSAQKVATDQQVQAANGDGAPANNSGSNAGVIIASTVGAVALAAIGAAAFVIQRRRRSFNESTKANGAGGKSQPLLMGGGRPSNVGGIRVVPNKPAGASSAAKDSASAPLNPKYKVIHEYSPSLPDELELRKGDDVEVKASFDDGWGKGMNMATGKEGIFPLACVVPLE
ncbi:E3 ubiquitin-protein ligase sh3rf2 [Quaeritorhiza haematococci]|nr:E3 ubiquitin-protein ligase sh3rf2 [Quaeritorhiza haematococci]